MTRELRRAPLRRGDLSSATPLWIALLASWRARLGRCRLPLRTTRGEGVMFGRFGEVRLLVDRKGNWGVELREGRREVVVMDAHDSHSAQAAIAKFMSGMAALAARGAKLADGYAIDTVVPPRATEGGEVVQFPRAQVPPNQKGRTRRPR
jgi:hypothetical protein